MRDPVTPRLITFETEEQLHDHAEKLNQIGVSPDVPIIDSRGNAMLASRTAPGGDGWGFAYYLPGEDGFMECIHVGCTDCGGPRNRETAEWKPFFPVTGLVCYDLTGAEGIL
jgi:hypothetical protein